MSEPVTSSPGAGGFAPSAAGRLSTIGGLAFYVLLTIGFLTTSHASRPVVVTVRWIALALVLGVLVVWFLRSRFHRRVVTAIGLYLAFIVFPVALSVIYGAFSILPVDIFTQIALISAGIVVWIGNDDAFWIRKLPHFIISYTAVCLVTLYLVGGIAPDLPPRFIYEYTADLYDEVINYSQELSKLFGIAAVAVLSSIAHTRGWGRITGGFLAIVALLALSLMGGARGDSLAAMIVVIFGAIMSYPVVAGLLIAVVPVSLVVLLPGVLDDVLIVNRLLKTIDGDLGERDQLLLQALQLLAENPNCVIAGCGAGFFQFSYGFPYFRYPHNVIAESFITFGLPLSLAYFTLLAVAVRAFARQRGWLSFPVLFFAYAFIISLKSFDLFGNPFLTLLSLFFISRWICDNGFAVISRRAGVSWGSGHSRGNERAVSRPTQHPSVCSGH
jgi:hypothetical protein